jgi:ribosomal-protein-alanine N-acetyltransferase
MKTKAIAKGKRVYIRRPTITDKKEFIAKARASRKFLYPWIDIKNYSDYFASLPGKSGINKKSFLICSNENDAILGVININEIVMGAFRSGYLGYFIFEQYAGNGYMAEGMRLVIRYAFNRLKLHRLEANIQPGNKDSLRLVKRLGFAKEGYSPRYLKIAGRWRDHQRWAILRED